MNEGAESPLHRRRLTLSNIYCAMGTRAARYLYLLFSVSKGFRRQVLVCQCLMNGNCTPCMGDLYMFEIMYAGGGGPIHEGIHRDCLFRFCVIFML